jgi:hypothetical protein
MVKVKQYEIVEILVSGEEKLRGVRFVQNKAQALEDAWVLSRAGAVTRVDYVTWTIGKHDNAARKTVWHSQRNR